MSHIISFMGAPGVGKSYLATRLVERTGFFFFDRDLIYDHVFKDDRESEHYRAFTVPFTKSGWELAMKNARLGASTILESPMTDVIQGKRNSSVDDSLKRAQNTDVRFSIIYCVAPEHVVYEQLKKRGCARDEPKYDAWKKFTDTFIHVPGPLYDHLRIDTTWPADQNLEEITSYIFSEQR